MRGIIVVTPLYTSGIWKEAVIFFKKNMTASFHIPRVYYGVTD